MKHFEVPEIEVAKIDIEDVITTSLNEDEFPEVGVG